MSGTSIALIVANVAAFAFVIWFGQWTGQHVRRLRPEAPTSPPADCLYSREGKACRLLPDLERELWCANCQAYEGEVRR